MRFDRKKFFDKYRAEFGDLSQQQVNGLNFILDSAEQDAYLKKPEWLGYMLATTKHETADTFQPIHEYGSHSYFVRRYGSQTALGRRLGNDTPEEGADYAGEGDVQLSGESNYERAETALRQQYPELVAAFEARTGRKFDLTVGDQPGDKDDPKNAGDPAIAYAIMSYGMRTGMFTGKKLADYDLTTDAGRKAARKIINGQDKAALIAGYAEKFNRIVKVSRTSSSAVVLPDTTNGPTSDEQVATGLPPSGDTPGSSQEQPPALAQTGDVVVEKEENLPFFTKIWKKFTGWLASVGGLTALQGYKQSIDDLGLPGFVIEYLLIAAVVFGIVWIGWAAAVHFWQMISRRWLTTTLVNANATPTNTVIVACPEDLAKYESLGYRVVRRQ